MKLFRLVLSLILVAFLSGCLLCKVDYGDGWEADNMVGTVPVTGYTTPEERCALKHTQQAIWNVKNRDPAWHHLDPSLDRSFIFIRNPNDKTPEICEKCFFGLYDKKCADTWVDIPNVMKTTPTDPSKGYRGLSEPNIFVSRIPPVDVNNALMNLCAHEWGCHEAAFLQHGDKCTEITRVIQKEATALMSADEECSQYLGR